MTKPLPDWPTMPRDERISLVKILASDGCSTGVIAAHFQNASRNAVIGLIHRVEAKEGKAMLRNRGARNRPSVSTVPAEHRSAPKSLPVIEPPARKQHIRPFNAQMKAAAPPVPDRELPAEKRGSFDPIPGVKPVPIIELPLRLRCRWPVDVRNDDLKFACGAATCSDTHVYCAPHRQLSVARPTQGAYRG